MDNSLGVMSVGLSLETAGLVAGLSGARDMLGGFAGVAASALGGAAVAMTKMAGDFQMSTTQLVTSAGEQASALDTVRHGLLAMAPQVGTSIDQLTKGMYMAESAGFHLANGGLLVLQNAAMGAKAENADLGVVMNAVTSAMNAYHLGAEQSATVTNTLVGATASGKMHMQDLAGALSNVLPASSKFGVSLVDTTAAIATMTMQGDNASSAATHLRQVLIALEAPAKAGASALTSIGLTTADVAAEMRVSLPGAIQMIVDHLAKEFPAGSEAYNQALKNIAGGSKQLLGLLELSGTSLSAFKDNVVAITGDVKAGGDSIMGWDLIQQNWNFKLDQGKALLEAVGIKIGTVLLPMAGQLYDQVRPLVQQFSDWASNANNLQGVLSTIGGVIKSDVVDPALKLWKAVDPIITDFERWNDKTHFLQNTLHDVGGFINDVAGYIANNLVPPIRSLIGNLEQWLTKSNIVHDALQALGGIIGTVSGVVGTLVGWISSVVGWFGQSKVMADILKDAILGIGIAIGGLKILELAQGMAQGLMGLVNSAKLVGQTLAAVAQGDVPLLKMAVADVGTTVKTALVADITEGATISEAQIAKITANMELMSAMTKESAAEAGVALSTDIGTGAAKAEVSIAAVGVEAETTAATVKTASAGMSLAFGAIVGGIGLVLAAIPLIGTLNQQTHDNVVKLIQDEVTKRGYYVSQITGQIENAAQHQAEVTALSYQKQLADVQGFTSRATQLLQGFGSEGTSIMQSMDKSTQLYWNNIAGYLANAQSILDSYNANVAQDTYNAAHSGLGTGHMHALGGTNLAAGDSYIAGERGPELITPAGSTNVYTASQTSSMLNGGLPSLPSGGYDGGSGGYGGGARQPVHIHIHLGTREVANELIEDIGDSLVRRMRLRTGMRV